jgi:hypothetical protein
MGTRSLKSVAQVLKKTTGPATVVYSLKGIYTTSSAANIGDRTSGEQTLTGATGYYGYDRIADSTDEYEQINPFAVEDGYAPDPANWPPSPISYSLAAWDLYVTNHFSAPRAKSTSFDCTNITDTTATFTWTRAAGYTRNTAELDQRVYVDTCDSDPFGACDGCGLAEASSSSACCDFNAADAETGTATTLTEGTCYVATVTTLWDGKGTGMNKYESDTADSVAEVNLTEGIGITSEGGIYFRTAYTNCQQIANPGYDGTTGFNACNGTSVGTLYSPNGASSISTLSVNDNIFTDSDCTSGLVSDDFVSDLMHSVDTNGGGTVSATPVACGI